MPRFRNQHQMYAYEALPLVFHNETKDFLEYLKRDGVKFLKFWWDRAGITLDETLRIPSEGLAYEIKTYKDGRDVILVKLPAPKNNLEAYYLALVARPLKHSFFPWRNLARVFALRRSEEEDGSVKTILAEVTRTARTVPIGKGPKPNMDDFYEVVCKILDSKK